MDKIYYTKSENENHSEGITMSESIGDRIESRFVDQVCSAVVDVLQIGYNDKRIVNSLLQKTIGESIKGHKGLLSQYESYVLDKSSKRIVDEFDLGTVGINHSHATHAKFAHIISSIKAIHQDEIVKLQEK